MIAVNFVHFLIIEQLNYNRILFTHENVLINIEKNIVFSYLIYTYMFNIIHVKIT